ncbi:MAG TPA: T9SS type A sorting domain-containing protein [Bacteroidia bacterium]|nr:T9SS type A sorting domain-containing protein [Bacteroidia bacterium]
MKKLLPALFTLLTGTLFAQSPITLSNSNMPGSNDTLRYSNAALNSVGNYTQTGTNFNWNFMSLVPVSQGRRDYKSAFSTPYAFFFLGLNEYGEKVNDTINLGVVTLTDVYNFYKKSTSPNAYIVDGMGMKISGVPVPSYFSDKDELYMFPMTYPKYDSTTFKFSTPSTTLMPIVYSKTGYRVTKVDGWGSITTPYGTANCLRIVTTQYSKDTMKTSLLPFPIGFNNYQRSYQWLTTTSKIPYLEVNGTLVGNNFTVTQVRYRDSYKFLAGVEENEENGLVDFYPNPVNDKLFLNFKKGNAYTIEIFDLNGKLLVQEKLTATDSSNAINVSVLAQGVYTVRVLNNETANVFKFIKQ